MISRKCRGPIFWAGAGGTEAANKTTLLPAANDVCFPITHNTCIHSEGPVHRVVQLAIQGQKHLKIGRSSSAQKVGRTLARHTI